MSERDSAQKRPRTDNPADDRMRWLASFPEQNPNPIIELDLSTGEIHYLNPAAVEAFSDLPALKLQHPSLIGLSEALKPMIEKGLKVTRREIAVGKFVFLQTITLLENQHIRIYNANVTEQHRADFALRNTQALYHSLVEQIPAGVFRKDTEGRYVFVNSSFCDFFGRKPAHFLGKTPRECALADIRAGDTALSEKKIRELADAADQHHSSILATGESIELEEERLFTGGRKQYFHVVKAPVFRSDGKIIGSQGVMLDITARKVAEEKVRELNAELEQRVSLRTAELQSAIKELEAFSYSVSHDLRAPLRAINGFSAMALEDFGPLLPEKGRRYLNIIHQDGLRMGTLIDDLLAFSRLSREPLKPQPVDTDQLVRQTLGELSAEKNGRELEIRVGELPACEGDYALLKQVWMNLLSNALKYSRHRKPANIEIGSSVEAGERVYFVRDNGAGFNMEYAGKLFGVFQRLHHQDEFEGTGVGLAIAQRIVNRHGGRIWAQAKEQQGATFYFTLTPGGKK
jgi:PAS domain S-box-containing protein